MEKRQQNEEETRELIRLCEETAAASKALSDAERTMINAKIRWEECRHRYDARLKEITTPNAKVSGAGDNKGE